MCVSRFRFHGVSFLFDVSLVKSDVFSAADMDIGCNVFLAGIVMDGCDLFTASPMAVELYEALGSIAPSLSAIT